MRRFIHKRRETEKAIADTPQQRVDTKLYDRQAHTYEVSGRVGYGREIDGTVDEDSKMFKEKCCGEIESSIVIRKSPMNPGHVNFLGPSLCS